MVVLKSPHVDIIGAIRHTGQIALQITVIPKRAQHGGVGSIQGRIKDDVGIAISRAVRAEIDCRRCIGLPVVAVDSYGRTVQVDRAIKRLRR